MKKRRGWGWKGGGGKEERGRRKEKILTYSQAALRKEPVSMSLWSKLFTSYCLLCAALIEDKPLCPAASLDKYKTLLSQCPAVKLNPKLAPKR